MTMNSAPTGPGAEQHGAGRPPKQRIGYTQGGQFYQSLQDLDLSEEYYEVYNNGSIEVVSGMGSFFGQAGAAVGSAIGGLFGSGAAPKPPGKPLPPEAQRAFRDAVEKKLGYDPGPDLAYDHYQKMRRIERGLRSGEDLKKLAAAQGLKAPTRDPISNEKLDQQGLDVYAAMSRENDEKAKVNPGGLGEVMGRFMAGGTGPKTGSGSGGGSFADGAAGSGGYGSGLAGDQSGGSAQAPGQFGGVEVTPELLRDFVESDWRLGFNAMVNSFRDAGGAAKFLQFLNDSAMRFLGEYEGELAEQALRGEIPRGDFVSYLQRVTGAQLGGDPNAVSGQFQDFAPQANVSGSGSGGGSGSGSGSGAPAPAPAGSVGPTPGAAPAQVSGQPVSPSAGETAGLTPNSLSTHPSGRPMSNEFLRAVTGAG